MNWCYRDTQIINSNILSKKKKKKTVSLFRPNNVKTYPDKLFI